VAFLLILISFLAAWVLFSRDAREPTVAFLEEGFLKSALIHGLVIAVSTELLSFSRNLSQSWVVLLWLLMAAIHVGLLLWGIRQGRYTGAMFNQPVRSAWDEMSGLDRGATIATGVILLLTLSVALLAPPNNHDSLTYHMPRVMHWIQNQTVAHYPTSDLRQISFAPGASYIVTQLYLLAGSDQFANGVQWMAFLGSIVGVANIANLCGIRPAIAALVCATIPMAVLQSATTQTDLATSFWLVCFAYFILRRAHYPWADSGWLALSLGLSILTKPTAFIFSAPLVVLLGCRALGGWGQWRKIPAIAKALSLTSLVVAMALLISLPSFWRNFNTFGNPLGTDGGTRNQVLGLGVLISNVLRNLALNLPFDWVWRGIQGIHQLLGLDSGDPRTSLVEGGTFLEALQSQLSLLLLPIEDFVGNPLHLLLILGGVGLSTIALLRPQSQRSPGIDALNQLVWATGAAFLLWSGLLKWQIWGNRLLLPWLILSAPLAAYFLVQIAVKRLQILGVSLLVMIAGFYSMTALYRPLLPLPAVALGQPAVSVLQHSREAAYFNFFNSLNLYAEVKQEYTQAADGIAGYDCRSLAVLNQSRSEWHEYLLWALLKARVTERFRIQSIRVGNQSQRLLPEFSEQDICGVLQVGVLQWRYFVRSQAS